MQIQNRWTGAMICQSETGTIRDLVEAHKGALYGANLCGANLCGADLRGANLCGANLYGTHLSGVDLRGAHLCGADLRGANLCGADLYGADLCDATLDNVPAVSNLDAQILAALADGGNLKMGDWHTCETTHCRAGWAIHLAGEEGRVLEDRYGPAVAGTLIYWASAGYIPDFYASDADALADIRAHAAKS